MTRIWFNHWFRTAYSLIELMKQGKENVYIIGSHSCEYSPIRTVCDEWYCEEELPEEEYVEFCLSFCKKHSVDVFVPHRCMTAIARNEERFDAIGVKLLSDDHKKLDLLENKSESYKFFADSKIIAVPDYITVNTAEEFAAAYEKLNGKYGNVCVKFVKDEGGQSFRRVTPKTDMFKGLHHYAEAALSYKMLYAALSTCERFDDLIVMPYLPGCEVSVDCLQTDGGFIMLPRYKGSAHIEKLFFDEEILAMTEEIIKKTDLQYPCDVQFRYLNNKPYLLEVNARMSGGLPMTCAATGVNIPALALQKLLGHGCPMPVFDKCEKIFSNVELPVIVK